MRIPPKSPPPKPPPPPSLPAAAKPPPPRNVSSAPPGTSATSTFRTHDGESRPAQVLAAQTSRLARASTPGPAREPAEGVAFVRDFNAALNLPPARLDEKLAMMRESPAQLYRAMPALFAADVRGPYAEQARLTDRPAPNIRVVGDAHVGNLGTFRGPEGKAVWGINDFDQSGVASPEMDLTRMAASAVLTAREAGLSPEAQAQAVRSFSDSYFRTLASLARGEQSPGAFLGKKESSGEVKDLIEKARDKTPADLLKKYVTEGADGPRIKLSPGKLEPLDAGREAAVREALDTYGKSLWAGGSGVQLPLEVLDVAARVDAGGSSYGLERDYALLRAADPSAPPVLVELKELLSTNVASPPVPTKGADVMQAQRELSGFANPLTGEVSMGGRQFLVREVEPEKDKLDDDDLLKDLNSTLQQAGRVLARAHGHTPAQASVLTHWLGSDTQKATRRLTAFAQSYADQVEADWKALKATGQA